MSSSSIPPSISHPLTYDEYPLGKAIDLYENFHDFSLSSSDFAEKALPDIRVGNTGLPIDFLRNLLCLEKSKIFSEFLDLTTRHTRSV